MTTQDYQVGDKVEIHLSDAGWVRGAVTELAGKEVVVRTWRGSYTPVSIDTGRIRHYEGAQ